MQDKVVLVIDDDPEAGAVLTRLLERRGYGAVAARSGSEGLGVLSLFVPSAIILAVARPDAEAVETLRRVRQEPKLAQVPVIIFSGDTSFQRMHEMLAMGADDYVVRGMVDWDHLLSRIKWHITDFTPLHDWETGRKWQ